MAGPEVTMLATAYCGNFGRGSINGTGVTAGGTDLRDGKQKYVIAAGPGSGLSIGDTVNIVPNPFGDLTVFKVDDHGGAIVGRHIDIYVADCNKAKQWGKKTVKVIKLTGKESPGPPTPPNLNPVKEVTNTFQAITEVANAVNTGVVAFEKFIEALFKSSTWFRVGKVLVGVILGVYGFIILTRPAVDKLPPTLKNAAAAAAIA